MKQPKNKPIPVYCPELDREFKSITSAARILDLSLPNLRKVLKGKRKSCGGYTFKKVEGEDKHEGDDKVSE